MGPCERSHCDDLRQSDGLTQTVTPTGHEPKIIETNVIDAEAISPEDLEPRRIELDRNLGTDPYQIHERLVRSSLSEDMDELGKVGAEMSYLQSQMHSDYDSAESIADSDLEDEKYQKCWLHHSICKVEKTVNILECQSHRGNLLHCFHLDMKNGEVNLRVPFSETLTRQNVGRSLPEGNKDHLLSQARFELMRQEHQVGSLNNCVIESQQHSYAQRLELQDDQHGYIESPREQVRLLEELSMKERFLPRYSNPKHARNGRNEKSSRTTS